MKCKLFWNVLNHLQGYQFCGQIRQSVKVHDQLYPLYPLLCQANLVSCFVQISDIGFIWEKGSSHVSSKYVTPKKKNTLFKVLNGDRGDGRSGGVRSGSRGGVWG